jgi:hypothetical protein
MARLVGFILMLVAIYLGVVVYTEGTDRAFGGLFASAEEAPVEAEEGPAATAIEDERAPGTPAPSAITSRVRDRVQSAVDERSDRIGAR